MGLYKKAELPSQILGLTLGFSAAADEAAGQDFWLDIN
jgi:hypothetical protein